MVRPKKSSPTLPINRVGMPNLCKARPVLETGPPVLRIAGPTSRSWPGEKAKRLLARVGIISRHTCPATRGVMDVQIFLFKLGDSLPFPNFGGRICVAAFLYEIEKR